MQLLGQLHVAARAQPPDPGGVAGHEGLRKHDQLGASAGGLVDCGHDFGQRGGAVEERRRVLDDGDATHDHTCPARIHFSPTATPSRIIVSVASILGPRTTPRHSSLPYLGLCVSHSKATSPPDTVAV